MSFLTVFTVGAAEIHRIEQFGSGLEKSRPCVLVAAGNNEMSFWDVESSKCTLLLRAREPGSNGSGAGNIDMTVSIFATIYQFSSVRKSLTLF